MADRDTPPSQIPESRTVDRKKGRFSLVWIIPIVAALVGAWVAAVKIMNQGPTITIVLRTAEGLAAGKTEVHYNGVTIGTVKSLRLTADHTRVVATVEMAPKTEDILIDDTKFWVVKPRVTGANISGLGTLISGAYFGVEIGKSKKKRTQFEALQNPPIVTGEVPGRFFVLKTTDLGSIDYGTPIYYRRLRVGQVASYVLDKNGQTLTIKVFVDAPYDNLVTPETRFWQASGINASITSEGVHVQTESVMAMLIGGLAFETPANAAAQSPAAANTVFTLYDDRTVAFQPPPKHPEKYLLVFNQSVSGLDVGAPVEFMGIKIGQVTNVHAQFNAENFKFNVQATIEVDPERLGVKIVSGTSEEVAAKHRQIIDTLIAHGLRTQLQSGNMLTGSKIVAFDFFPEAPPFKMDWSQNPPRLATVPDKLQGLGTDIAGILAKLNKLPYLALGKSLQTTLSKLDHTLASATGVFDNANAMLNANAGLGRTSTTALQEVGRAARSLRILADYLERHPEALIRGKPAEKKPPEEKRR